MLRSFDYARWPALRRVAHERRRDRCALGAARRATGKQATRAAFLGAYDAGARGAALYASRAGDARGLLELFELEKALYELRYELDNRPDWVRMPLRGILASPARARR